MSLTRRLAFTHVNKESEPKTRLQQKVKDLIMQASVISILLFSFLAMFVAGQFYVLSLGRRAEAELIAKLKFHNWSAVSGPPFTPHNLT